MKKYSEKIGLVERIGYCAIEIGNSFCWTMVSTYLSVFYTDVVGLAPAAVSMILLIARIWDGINDPMMGMIVEKTNTRWGKFRPYLMFAAPFVAIFSILTFTKTGLMGNKAVLYCLVTYICCGMAYTAVCIPQGSLVNVMTRDSQVRVEMNAMRQIGNKLNGLIISACTMPMILFFGAGNTSSPRGYFITTVLFAIFGMCCVVFGGIVCKERIKPTKGSSVKIKDSFLYVARNRNALLIAINGIFHAGASLGRTGVLSYFFIYYIKNPALMASVVSSTYIAGIVVQFFIPSLTKRMDKKWACVMAYAGMAVSLLIIFLGGNNMVTLYLGSIMFGFCNYAPSLMYTICGEIADKEEVETGRRSDALIYSMLSLGTKIGIAVGGSIGVLLLGAIGYIPNADQTASTLRGINMIANVAPIVFFALAAACVGLVTITNKEASQNREILEKRAAEIMLEK